MKIRKNTADSNMTQPTSARARVEKGVSSEGFTTAVQPAASAVDAFLKTMAKGKFHGVMRAHTPTGCLMTKILLFLTGEEMTSPSILFASSANHLRKEAPYATSISASEYGFP